MDEYIKREAVIDRLKRNLDACNPGSFSELCYRDAIETVKCFPAADVAPVVHARWEYDLPTINTYGQLRCSICNWWTLDPSVDRSYSYCPNCGAKMDGGDNDAKSM